jgi:large conductance mechanosensitive channel
MHGVFLNAVIAFIFFFVIKPVNRLMESRRGEAPVDERTRSCPECRSNIPVLASRCAFCTTQVTPEEQPASA